MQDRTINNALLALRKQGGHEGKLAEVLLDMRGVEWTGWVQDRPLQRGQTKSFLISELREGPKTNTQLTTALRKFYSELDRRSAGNRCYQALVKLESKGVVYRDGRVWALKPPAANTPSSYGLQARPLR